MPPLPPEHLPPLYTASMPPQVDLVPEVFERPDVRRAEIAGVGGIFTARSNARFWAMLAQGGALDGVRLLSQDLVATLNTPRARSDEPDPVMFGMQLPLSIAGYLAGRRPTAGAGQATRARSAIPAPARSASPIRITNSPSRSATTGSST